MLPDRERPFPPLPVRAVTEVVEDGEPILEGGIYA
jgi:hypothetical protein